MYEHKSTWHAAVTQMGRYKAVYAQGYTTHSDNRAHYRCITVTRGFFFFFQLTLFLKFKNE